MMMTKLVSVEDKVHTPVDCINICMGKSVGIFSHQMGSQKTVCCRLFAEMEKPSVFVQKAQMIVCKFFLMCLT